MPHSGGGRCRINQHLVAGAGEEEAVAALAAVVGFYQPGAVFHGGYPGAHFAAGEATIACRLQFEHLAHGHGRGAQMAGQGLEPGFIGKRHIIKLGLGEHQLDR